MLTQEVSEPGAEPVAAAPVSAKERLAPYQWKPGQSGWTGGRKEKRRDTVGITDYAQKASLDAIKRLHRIVLDQEARASDAINASKAILERAWGKPSQAVVVSGGVAHVDVSVALASAIATASKDAARIIDADATIVPALPQPQKPE